MIGRVRLLLLALVPVYGLWVSLLLSVGRRYTVAEVAGNVVMGVVFGMLAASLSDNISTRLHARDGLVNTLFFTLLAVMFAAFTLRGNFIYGYVDFFGETVIDRHGIADYIARFAWRGGVLGVMLWLLALVTIGLNIGTLRGGFLAAGVTLLSLLSAPYFANVLFNGAPFVAVTLSTRLTLSLLAPYMSTWWQGFLFGLAAGFVTVMLPFLGFYGYGSV